MKRFRIILRITGTSFAEERHAASMSVSGGVLTLWADDGSSIGHYSSDLWDSAHEIDEKTDNSVGFIIIK